MVVVTLQYDLWMVFALAGLGFTCQNLVKAYFIVKKRRSERLRHKD